MPLIWHVFFPYKAHYPGSLEERRWQASGCLHRNAGIIRHKIPRVMEQLSFEYLPLKIGKLSLVFLSLCRTQTSSAPLPRSARSELCPRSSIRWSCARSPVSGTRPNAHIENGIYIAQLMTWQKRWYVFIQAQDVTEIKHNSFEREKRFEFGNIFVGISRVFRETIRASMYTSCVVVFLQFLTTEILQCLSFWGCIQYRHTSDIVINR